MIDNIFNVFFKFIDQDLKREIALALKIKLDDKNQNFDMEFENAINKFNPRSAHFFQIECVDIKFRPGSPANFSDLLQSGNISDGLAKNYVNNLLNCCRFTIQLQELC